MNSKQVSSFNKELPQSICSAFPAFILLDFGEEAEESKPKQDFLYRSF